MRKVISYSAPAKVILSGEHAVVYGKPALVSAVNLRLRFSVVNLVKDYSWSSRTHQKREVEGIKYITKKVKDFIKKKNSKFNDKKFDYQIKSKIPIGRGLGSSAALSVAATAALLKFYTNKDFDKETINNLAYQGEKYFHKNPSGVDVSASCFGGLIFYRKEFEFLKNISSLSFKIPQKIEDNLYLIDSGKPEETTAEMVELVGRLYNKKPMLVEQILTDIEKITKRMTVSLIKEDVGFFKQSIVDNEVLLEMLGVVSKKTKALLEEFSPYGVGKITGAGGKKSGSGYILFYADKKKELESFLKKKKIKFFQFKQDNQGLINN